MAKYSMQDIKKLREETGARVLDCKKALDEAGGDLAQAKEIVAAKDLARADKTAGRETKEGFVASYVHNTGKVAALVEVQCETDFVAKNDEFRTLARNIAMQVAAMNPENVADLLAQDYIKDPELDVQTYLKSVSGKIGENMVVARFVRFELGGSTQAGE